MLEALRKDNDKTEKPNSRVVTTLISKVNQRVVGNFYINYLKTIISLNNLSSELYGLGLIQAGLTLNKNMTKFLVTDLMEDMEKRIKDTTK